MAYILCTSGSTGVPKGVVHTHGSAVSFVDWATRSLGFREDDRFSSHAPFSFDLSILDLFVAIGLGATVVLIDEQAAKDPRSLPAVIDEQRISVWYSVPSALSLMLDYGRLESRDLSSLRVVCFAGEVFPIARLRRLRRLLPGRRMFNLYGPTETNVCTFMRIPDDVPDDRTAPYPIGVACDHCSAMVVDESHRVIDGMGEGELLVRAEGPVMSGYFDDPVATERAMHIDEHGMRWYRTGDMVRIDAAGDYEFVGRRDRMIKKSGYRIELGEIESVLQSEPTVRAAAVVAIAAPEGTRLHAFIESHPGEASGVLRLRAHCATHLPVYMIPDRFSFVDELPRTATGKTDLRAMEGVARESE